MDEVIVSVADDGSIGIDDTRSKVRSSVQSFQDVRMSADSVVLYSATPVTLVQPRSPRVIAVGLAVIFAGLAGGCATVPEQPVATVRPSTVEVKLIAFNDFHGNLRIPGLRVPVADPAQTTGVRFEPAGGIEQFAAIVAQLKSRNPNHAVVSAGDMVGATPLMSALFKDEPTIEAMNLIGLDFHAVGNHEFDYGVTHLKRLQAGGCEISKQSGQPDCQGRTAYAGANFGFLAANVMLGGSDATLFPPYGTKEFDGIKVGFIGLTLKTTAALVRPSGTTGLTFRDEADTVNRLVPTLHAAGAQAIVVVVHEGGEQTGGINECTDFKGAARGIAERLSPEVAVVITGHTHRFYVCEVAGKLVTSAGSYGTLVTEIDLTLDRASGRVVQKTARNLVVKPDGPKDVRLTALVERYAALSEPLEKRVVAIVKQEINGVANPAGESTLANLIADAHLFATTSPDRGGAVMAFNNRGSLRAPIIPDAAGGVAYGELFKTQPFQNDLVVMNLTGAQIKQVLEQQWSDATSSARGQILGVSQGFSYAWDASKPIGERVIAESMRLNGATMQQTLEYRVTANSFVAAGSEGLTVFREGRDRQISVLDLDALVEYLAVKSPYQPPAVGSRIRRLN